MAPRARRFGLVATMLLLSACAAPPAAREATAPPAEALARLARQHHVCAVATAVIRQRALQSVTAASGCEPAWQVRPDSVFQAASLSKPVFAYAVLKLVQQGRMALDAPVMQVLPGGYRHAFDPLRPDRLAQSDDVTDPRLQAVTVRMLLQHTAGLPNWARGPLRFQAEPGAGWAYSGEGYVLLQRAVEAVMQQPLDVVMQQQVFEPLGMTRSSYRWTPDLDPDLVAGTQSNGVARRVVHLQQPVAAFSLYTTAADYARFTVALLNDAALLATTAGSPVDMDASPNLAWGLGWGLERGPGGMHLWQWGSNPGYRAFVMVDPGSGDGLVLLTNSDAGLRLVDPLVQAALPGDHPALRSPFVSASVSEWLCDWLRLCF